MVYIQDPRICTQVSRYHTCLTATSSPVAFSIARYTVPKLPLPSSSSISYRSAMSAIAE